MRKVVGFDSRRWGNLAFAALFVLSLILFSRIILPFLMPVLLGGFLVVLFAPAHDRFCSWVKGRDALCAALSTALVFLVILVPLAVISYLVAREILGVMDYARDLLERVDLRRELAEQLPRGLRRYVRGATNSELEKAILGAVAGGAGALTRFLAAGTEFVIDVFLMVVAMYYFFLDGRRLVAEFAKLLPIEPRYFRAFVKEFQDVAYAIMYGNTLTAVIQGAVGLVGLYVAKVPHAPVWAVAMIVFAMIPIGGTALVWGPIGIALIVTRHFTEGIFLLGWGTFLVSTIDNVVRPRLCGSRMALHPLMVFLSMFGGLAVFGMMGLLVGPLIASLFMAMVRIYRRDFLPTVSPAPVVAKP